jgi:hypothetical protein
MIASIRRGLPILTLIVVVLSASNAHAQYPDTVTISYPSSGTTWIGGNGVTTSGGVSGNTPVSTMRVTIFATAAPNMVYFSNTSNYTSFWYINYTCPHTGTEFPVPCTLKLEAIGSDGSTVVGSATVSINIVNY